MAADGSAEGSVQTFVFEAREQLAVLEDGLLRLSRGEAGDGAAETVNELFRAAHTIKGSAGLFGLEDIVSFTHAVESVLSEVRDGVVQLEGELPSLLLESHDHIARLVDAAAGAGDPPDVAVGADLGARLRAWLPATPTREVYGGELSEGAIWGDDGALSSLREWGEAAEAAPRRYRVVMCPVAEALRNAVDPVAFLDHLGEVGRLLEVETDTRSLPGLDAIDPTASYLSFSALVESEADRAAVEGVFAIALEDCPVEIQEEAAASAGLIGDEPGEGLIGDQPEGGLIGDQPEQVLESIAAPVVAETAPAPIATAAAAPIVVELTPAPPPPPAPVQAAAAAPRAAEARAVRVDADKLDHLIDVVGELIIAAASTNLVARRARVAELAESTSKLAALVEEVRDSALQLRMVKFAGTFNRFHRVVHDVSRELGKRIRLEVSGEETELDKTVVEKLADPLVHLVRNAIDHGIESAEVRAARGKPAEGTVRLNAFHDSGNIVIEISDDGGGLRRDRILAKATERGLVEPGRVLSGREIDQLIFLPGFSTADQVTNLSGRGVGMDVVHKNITAVRGTVTVDSSEGIGTTFTVRLPLTLAIIHGFLVGVGTASFVLPIEAIEECVEMRAEPGKDYTNLRGQVLPFLRLGELVGAGPSVARRQNIVVVRHAGHKVGVVVDTLLGEFHTVIKPLGKLFQRVKFVTGSTILGNGEVALTLDVPALVERAMKSAEAAHHAELVESRDTSNHRTAAGAERSLP